MTDLPRLDVLLDVARGRLSARAPRTLPQEGLRRAAVCLVMMERAGVPSVLLIKRAATGRNSGQWALPGGRVDAAETTAEAALRELEEEVGLRCGPETLLGRLDDLTAGSGHLITPWVVAAPGPTTLHRNPAEVASLHPIPLARLVAPGVPRWRDTPDGPLLQMPLRHDMIVHAPTGALLWQFAEVVLRGHDLRLDQVAEPDFARS